MDKLLRKNNALIEIKTMKKTTNATFWRGAFIGFALYLCIYGIANINVTYDAFIFNDGRDIPQHYLGWVFFRMAEWKDLGMFNTLTYPNYISIIYTDSVPLIEFLFKLIAPVLPYPFQYFGIWGLLCFTLQGGVAALILDFYTQNRIESYVGNIIFILATPVLTKLFYHHALGSQFVILLGIFCWLNSVKNENVCRGGEKVWLCWLGIGFLTAGIHFYFIPMLGLIVLGQAVNIWLDDHRVWKQALLIVVSYIIGALFFFVIFGGFTNNFQMDQDYVESAIDLFYRCGANLDAFVNSWGISLIGKTYLTARDGQGEGLAYLGVGVFGVIIFGICSIINEKIRTGEAERREIDRHEKNSMYAQLMVVILSIIIAIGPTVCWHDKVLIEIPYPVFIIKMWSIFRCEGRFIWVAYYFIILWSFKFLSTCNIKEDIKKGILVGCGVIQLVDLFPYMVYKHKLYGNYYSFESELSDEAWNELGNKYDHLIVLPNIILSRGDQRYDIAHWAGKNTMTINDFYLARQSLIDQSGEIEKQICDGKIDDSTLYMLNQNEVYNILDSDIHLYLVDGWYLGTEEDISELIKKKEIEKTFLNTGKDSGSYIYGELDYASVFEPYYYYYSYPDLWDEYAVEDIERLFNHFITVGMKEGRRASDSFNPVIYQEKYGDLQAVFEDDWEAYFRHYIEYGIAEGRRTN